MNFVVLLLHIFLSPTNFIFLSLSTLRSVITIARCCCCCTGTMVEILIGSDEQQKLAE
jgi:hypothetical protein